MFSQPWRFPVNFFSHWSCDSALLFCLRGLPANGAICYRGCTFSTHTTESRKFFPQVKFPRRSKLMLASPKHGAAQHREVLMIFPAVQTNPTRALGKLWAPNARPSNKPNFASLIRPYPCLERTVPEWILPPTNDWAFLFFSPKPSRNSRAPMFSGAEQSREDSSKFLARDFTRTDDDDNEKVKYGEYSVNLLEQIRCGNLLGWNLVVEIWTNCTIVLWAVLKLIAWLRYFTLLWNTQNFALPGDMAQKHLIKGTS